MNWVIYIDIGTWSWIWCLHFFIARSVVTATKGSVNSFFCNNLILNVIFFLLVVVLAGTWVSRESLSSIRCFTFMFPKLSSFSFC